MKISFPTLVKKLKPLFSVKAFLSYWYRYYKAMVFFGFLGVIIFGGWEWYYSFYRYRLSDEEKKQYIEQNFRETIFKEKEFDTIVSALAERAQRHAEKIEIKRNIFIGEGVQEKK